MAVIDQGLSNIGQTANAAAAHSTPPPQGKARARRKLRPPRAIKSVNIPPSTIPKKPTISGSETAQLRSMRDKLCSSIKNVTNQVTRNSHATFTQNWLIAENHILGQFMISLKGNGSFFAASTVVPWIRTCSASLHQGCFVGESRITNQTTAATAIPNAP